MIQVPQFGKIVGLWVSWQCGRQLSSDKISVRRSCLNLKRHLLTSLKIFDNIENDVLPPIRARPFLIFCGLCLHPGIRIMVHQRCEDILYATVAVQKRGLR